jgi:hypothetical protein
MEIKGNIIKRIKEKDLFFLVYVNIQELTYTYKLLAIASSYNKLGISRKLVVDYGP